LSGPPGVSIWVSTRRVALPLSAALSFCSKWQKYNTVIV
jgi:hypothetical protein